MFEIRRKKNSDGATPEDCRKMIGDHLHFGAAEAYKLLRTNLSFSIPDEAGCKIIGITSALRAEGKSTTAVNIAYSMAQNGQKVLMIEADLRLPTVAKRLHVMRKPGLSNLLVGQNNGAEVIQPSGLLSNLWVIAAGDIPPNPAELLGSEQMATVIRTLAKSFDVIVVDMPPVQVVSDALILSKLMSGMVVVVRQNVCDRKSLDETVRQLQFVDAKILGFVMTGVDNQQKGYGRYRRYGQNSKYRYAYRYGYYGKNKTDVKNEG